MQRTEIDLFGLLVIIDGKKLMVKRWRWLPLHFTLFLEPEQRGRRVCFAPHVTDERRRKGKKLFYKLLDVVDLKRVCEGFNHDLAGAWVEACEPVTLSELENDGWFVVLFNDHKFGRWLKSLGGRRRRYKIREQTFVSILDCADDALAPAALEDASRQLRQPLTIVREPVGTDHYEFRFLMEYPDGFLKGPGWYTVRHDWLPEERLKVIFSRHIPKGFWVGLRRVGQLLRMGRPDAIDEIIAQYELPS